MQIPNLSLWQKIQLKLRGCAYIGHKRKHGWRTSLPFYIVKCKKHGLYEDYEHGYKQYFSCPKCFEETKK